MRKNKVMGIVLLVLFIIPVFAMAGKKDPWDVKLPFKNAVIGYTHSGMAKGSETLYVRDYGHETARYLKTTTSMMGMTNVDDTIVIQNPDWIYRFDMTQKTGSKMVNPQKYMKEEYEKLSAADKKKVDENSKEMGMSFASGMGGNIEKNVTEILGYSCDKVEIMGNTVYSIHGAGIPLRTESNIMGMKMKIEATSINKGKAKKQHFQFPEGIEPIADPQADAMSRKMAKRTIEMLKDPEAMQSQQGSPMMQRPSSGQADPGTAEGQPADMEQAMNMLKNMFGKEK